MATTTVAVALDDAVDLAMLERLDRVVAEATVAFEGYDYARALERTEAFFWWFCDDYVELVKWRAYGGRGDGPAASARTALRTALDIQQRLLAPAVPFAAEESWSWWHDSSVHASSWPAPSGVDGGGLDLDVVSDVLARVRRAKTEAKASQRAAVARLRIAAPAADGASLRAAADDLVDALTVEQLELVDAADGADVTVDVDLAAGPA